ncbi:MAG: hypothetical protein M1835_001946 [Candelina submexicana]|nr:MAG: hypothetical protein M1835_001946 [Candelina submexicana]
MVEVQSDLQIAASDGLQLGQPQPGLEVGQQPRPSKLYHGQGSLHVDRKGYLEEYAHNEEHPHPLRTICGLRPATFWLSVALGILIIIAAVGGGVGGSLGAKRSSPQSSPLPSQSQSPAQSPAATVTVFPVQFDGTSRTTSQPTVAATGLLDYIPPGAANVTTLALDCNTLNNTISYVRVPGIDAPFEVRCGNDQRGGFPAANNGGIIKDILPLTMYTFQDCMLACASWNAISRSTVCRGVTFGVNMSKVWNEHHSNCWLKNATGPGTYQDDTVASALLQ